MSTVKQRESFPGRTFYKPGGVNWGRFLPWLIPAFAVAVALAEGMYQLFHIGHYYVIIVPILASLAVGALITLAVKQGHCRNRLAAGAAGFAAGLVLYLGSYYLGMAHLSAQLGLPGAPRLDRLPSYIRLRMETDVTRDAYESRNDERKQSRSSDPTMNWIRFGIEFLAVLGITTAAGLKRSRKAYCQQCGHWMDRELTQFDPAQSTELLEALRTGSARSLAALCAKAAFTTVPNLTLAIESCPSLQDGRARDCPVYASIKNVTVNPQGAVLDAFEQAKGKVVVRGLQLNPDELAALALRFPRFEAHAGRSAVAALMPQEETLEPASGELENEGAFAEIEPLGQFDAGRIMTRKTILICNAFALSGLLGFFGGAGLMAWGALTAFPDNPPPGGVSPAAKARGIALMSGGGALMGGVLICMLIDTSLFGNRYLRNRLRQELSRRTSLVVDPRDPDALFVEVVPKLNWGKMKLEDASDVGLLLVDQGRRELRFEGDHERWRIPAAAITQCGFEEFAMGHTRRYFVVLRANYRDGFWEAPVRERRGVGLIPWAQKKAARRLFDKIEEMRGVSPAAPIAGT